MARAVQWVRVMLNRPTDPDPYDLILALMLVMMAGPLLAPLALAWGV